MSGLSTKAMLSRAGISTKDMDKGIKEVKYIDEVEKKTNASDNKELEAARKRAAAKAKQRKLAMAKMMGDDTEEKTDAELQQEAMDRALEEARQAVRDTHEVQMRRLPRLVALGGFDGAPGGQGRMRLVEAFDWETRKWESLRQMRCKRRMFGAAVVEFPPIKAAEVGEDGQQIVVAGDDDSQGSTSSDDADSSSEEEELPRPKIVVFGGQKNKSVYAEAFDAETNKWEALPERPPHMALLQRWGCACVAWRGTIVCAGGQSDEFTPCNQVEQYLPALADDPEKRWMLLPPLLQARSLCGLVVLHDLLIVVGGTTHNERLRSAEVYNEGQRRWDALPDMLFRRAGCFACVLNGKVTVFGGQNNFNKLKSVEQYDPELEAWVRLADMPVARSCMGGTVYQDSKGNERMVLAGGRASSYSWLDSVLMYDPAAGTWASIAPTGPDRAPIPAMQHRRDACACVVLGWPVYDEDDSEDEAQAQQQEQLTLEAGQGFTAGAAAEASSAAANDGADETAGGDADNEGKDEARGDGEHEVNEGDEDGDKDSGGGSDGDGDDDDDDGDGADDESD